MSRHEPLPSWEAAVQRATTVTTAHTAGGMDERCWDDVAIRGILAITLYCIHLRGHQPVEDIRWPPVGPDRRVQPVGVRLVHRPPSLVQLRSVLRGRNQPDSLVFLLAPEEFCAQVLVRARLWLQGGRSVDRLEHGRPQYLGVLGEVQRAELIATHPVGTCSGAQNVANGLSTTPTKM